MFADIKDKLIVRYNFLCALHNTYKNDERFSSDGPSVAFESLTAMKSMIETLHIMGYIPEYCEENRKGYMSMIYNIKEI